MDGIYNPREEHYDWMQKLRVGNYYDNGGLVTSSGTNIAANQLYASPLVIGRKMTLDRLAISVIAGGIAGTKARLGIYRDGNNLYPGSLLLDAGLVDVDAVAVVAAIINQQLAKGLYWLALISDGIPQLTIYSRDYGAEAVLGTGNMGFTQYNCGWIVAQAYGVLPDPFTAGGVLYNAAQPIIQSRIASLD